ncbi:MAG: cupin domain-containing protein [Ktedonobacteraceae bacterium]|jgi:mannose-6-phosphate isomerase-like protein (cupin superfamily)|nr:cupin domain-containing protein [Ktedonobacteraceae bacterium]MBO0790736.1 cupin domain-containing protein [Ktedonobacteraceae bacterium]
MPPFHHRKLPDYSTLLSGHTPPDDIGFRSERLQIWYNNTTTGWADPAPHKHLESDECFIVLQGTITVEVEGERFIIGPREFCCFPCGVYHSVIEVDPPVESLMIRAPSINDKVYLPETEQEG